MDAPPTPRFSRTRVGEPALMREGRTVRAAFCLSACEATELHAASSRLLHPRESERLQSGTADRWRENFLRGRLCAKEALMRLGAVASPSGILISNGVFGQPVVERAGADNLQVSLSHTSGWAAALAFEESHPMGIDLEVLNERRHETIRSQVLPSEVEAVATTRLPEPMRLTVLWTIKESLSKALRCGLMTPFAVYEIESSRDEGPLVACTFSKFAQYKSLSFVVGDVAISITLPRNTRLDLDPAEWRL